MLQKIGFFRFVEKYGEPFPQLEAALSGHGGAVGGSLIVLPEAFNYGGSYSLDPPHPPRISAVVALCKLAELSGRYRVVFVVGLLVPPRNSAYLIRADEKPLLVGHKRTQDHTRTYHPCGADCGGYPFECEGADIGVLICKDTEIYARWLAEQLSRSRASRKVICIPAHGFDGYLSGAHLHSRHWSNSYVVLANSAPYGTESFIANRAGRKAEEALGPAGKLLLKTWDELDSLRD